MRLTKIFAAFFTLSFLCAGGSIVQAQTAEGGNRMTMKIESPAFTESGEIPVRNTQEGQDLSPPLSWSGVPLGAKSLALIIDDPDAPDPAAPQKVWVHWVLYNIPTSATGLPEGADRLPEGTLVGLNDRNRTGYNGPMPPIGRHRYFHKLYALDTTLSFPNTPTKAVLVQAMQGHILAEATIIGTYKSKK